MHPLPPSITHLEYGHCSGGASDLALILPALIGLRALQIISCSKLSRLLAVRALSSLTSLDISQDLRATPATYAWLASLRNLVECRVMTFPWSISTPRGEMIAFAEAMPPTLQHLGSRGLLDFSIDNAAGVVKRMLSQLTALCSLSPVADAMTRSNCGAILAHCASRLQRFEMYSYMATEMLLPDLGSLTRVSHLTLGSFSFATTATGRAVTAPLLPPSLIQLHLNHVSNFHLELATHLTNLEVLDLSQCNLVSPKQRSPVSGDMMMSASPLAPLARMPRVTSLILSQLGFNTARTLCDGIGDWAPQLRALDLSSNTWLSDIALQPLTALTCLHHLDVRWTPLNMTAWPMIAQCMAPSPVYAGGIRVIAMHSKMSHASRVLPPAEMARIRSAHGALRARGVIIELH